MTFQSTKNRIGPMMEPQSHGGTQCAENRAYREPEDGVADAGERAHHTNLDALNGRVLNRSTIRALFLERQNDANDGSGDVGVSVVELEMALECRRLILLGGVQLLDGGNHCVAPTTVLHTLVVPGALKELVTPANRHAVVLTKLHFCH